jgi:hypothetical protein
MYKEKTEVSIIILRREMKILDNVLFKQIFVLQYVPIQLCIQKPYYCPII